MSEIASRTGVSTKSLRRWQEKQRQELSLEPGRPTGGPRKITPADEPALQAQVVAAPDATLVEHGAAWVAAGHAPVNTATLSRTLRRMGLPLKKDPDCHRARRGCTKPVARRGGHDRSRDPGLSGRNQHPDRDDPAAGSNRAGPG